MRFTQRNIKENKNIWNVQEDTLHVRQLVGMTQRAKKAH